VNRQRALRGCRPRSIRTCRPARSKSSRELLLLNEAKTPPFSPAEEAIANEEVRLKYRYLDLRRAEMQHNFKLRSTTSRWRSATTWSARDSSRSRRRS
jgi:hypothetical protein